MNENIENNDWKKDAPALAARQKRNPFTVPNGYFDSVEAHVAAAIFIDSLNKKMNDNVFEVPQDYFENLTERIETNIKLAARPKAEDAFAVPAGYFETLENKINHKIAFEEPKKEAKIIPLWSRNVVKYASAACFVLMASYGAYFYQNNSTPIPVTQLQTAELANEQLLYDIDESTIIEHLEAQNNTTVTNTSASDTEMENYLLSNYSPSDLSHELNNL
ncbi:hypothetical protein GJU39_00855 [Pedobacter petrophilus]|uniref:Uncharacterized protein n=1 Tax=Pedobacter petrophilus TaxID=1908241 RepID=A0A7K0FTA4_9SPHI|nr:hypothetical protein [Pedobacter petrophilus]MRX74621.1 hypothetical protein [Pedobacter petrophilus]